MNRREIPLNAEHPGARSWEDFEIGKPVGIHGMDGLYHLENIYPEHGIARVREITDEGILENDTFEVPLSKTSFTVVSATVTY